MVSKDTILTVIKDPSDDLDGLNDFPKARMDRSDYDPKISQILPPSISSSDESEMEDDSDSDNDNLDLIIDPEDPNQTLEQVESLKNTTESSKGKEEFRGRPSSCVFVASLASSKTDDELSISVTKHFEQWGTLALVKVLRDPSNRPYAFVQYTTDEDAKKALRGAQHSILDGRSIRCEPAKVNRTLYIATATGVDLPLKDIKDVLKIYGEVEQTVGNNDTQFRKSNLNKAWFCKFAYRDDAIRAYANLRLSPDWIVEWAQNIESPSEQVSKVEPEVVIDKFSVFVGQLDISVTKEKLDERFSRHGKINDIVLVTKPGNNFAFIKFETEKSAAAAVERENHAVFLEKTMHVQYRELHHKKQNFNNNQPRLNLAPPPVNLPVRRASTGSPMVNFNKPYEARQQVGKFSVVPNPNIHSNFQGPGSQAKHVHPAHFSNRSVSFSNDTANLKYRYSQYLGYPQTRSVENELTASLNHTPSKNISHDYNPSNDKHTPASSPSNHTINSSQGDTKSLYSSTNVSVGDHLINDQSTEPTSGFGTTKSLHSQRRNYSQVLSQNQPVPYYYYTLPEKNYVFDQSSYLAYASYPYYYPEPSLVDYPPPSLNTSAHGHTAPTPYYMYYGVPQGPNFLESQKSQNAGQFDSIPREADEIPEMDY
ncbi:Polyadenylate-binding protein, cytoplasmic and nuclear [Wickerhamomyces ciferrii]|uniref:Polyadenylate-binding protein, cytoplasmic and nuclear n=1 Tax=Wickerhamomyces ciferrii (strain ATCC 14091 / BCRC 22168 / CBS 111 / JCM 3599 / NBRC 0793 / NRRL Y-1031 F-60-10) TaxID=1206466 RepID=K0KRV4_WICCF|nr:Polyadenylate-binding protein, cytoplasmic and nuclear [Wickerhamomyces ciferrii]CCH44732.1 Polyadenylate-binding protein, cytoplasmic and nuclear [Wickerhamomyces ciferrii]